MLRTAFINAGNEGFRTQAFPLGGKAWALPRQYKNSFRIGHLPGSFFCGITLTGEVSHVNMDSEKEAVPCPLPEI